MKWVGPIVIFMFNIGVFSFVAHNVTEARIVQEQKLADVQAQLETAQTEHATCENLLLDYERDFAKHTDALNTKDAVILGLDAALKDADMKAQPCPGACDIPDCRVVLRAFEGLKICLEYVDKVKATLGAP